MKEWLANVIQPYITRVIEEDPDLDDDQMSILFIDAYPVHTSEEFRTMIFKEYPRIILIFVPQNCTGKFQPADVGLQCPIKHFLKQKIFQWMADTHQEQLSRGAPLEDIKITTSITELRDASVPGLVEAYEYMSSQHGRSLIKKAWTNCRTKGYSLSPECLTSKKTQAELRKYLQQDSTLREEIEARCGIVHGLNDSPEPLESDINLRIDSVDDDDVPLTAVISATFGETLNNTNFQKMEEGTLENNIEVEDVWAYDGAGRM
ncbi:hypothetical protein K435DRAFT_877776 [Dendrothele bispora CBS 962.96]|uniref:DDE-1 domain-containing protein n=1 Tax=Dendrothele bispora (strain CBS 962.96) TaxID=1314807 RepID=A0A4S8KPG0_DENBC|nr:hypothetical protein K435DRAFT_877776 [Dendrothele bispora CBS 962.96]